MSEMYYYYRVDRKRQSCRGGRSKKFGEVNPVLSLSLQNQKGASCVLVLRYLMNQVLMAAEAKESIFEAVTTKTIGGKGEVLYALRPGLTFHFFSNQSPCKLANLFVLTSNFQ